MSIGRRDFLLGTVAATAAAPLLPGCGDDESGDALLAALPVDAATFAHGVASGDPLADRVILWTRVSGAAAPVSVRWTIASDPQLSQVVQSGTAVTGPERDYTVQVDVTGLTAGTTYYYVFAASVGPGRSPTGRTRTLPRTAERARFVFTSCANYQNGYFNAYRNIAQQAELDFWIHLGDYIYEYRAGQFPELPVRPHEPANEAITLADYRARYGQYRRDPDLQEAHRQHPFIAIWDDHEFANNAYVDGAENHMPDSEGDWTARKRQAAQAFSEWMPVRLVQADPVPKIFRSFAFGELFDLIMLDTRMIARVQQAGSDVPPLSNTGDPRVWADPSRQLLGSEQEAWFLDTLAASRTRGAAWRFIGNQVVFAQTRSPLPNAVDPQASNITFSDLWDGYQGARARIIDAIHAGGMANVVFLTGDIHASFALEINRDPFSATPPPPFAVELVGPAVTSQAFEGTPFESAAPLLTQANPHARHADFTRKGFVLVDVTAQRVQAQFIYVDHRTPGTPGSAGTVAFDVGRNEARLVRTDALYAPGGGAPLAP